MMGEYVGIPGNGERLEAGWHTVDLERVMTNATDGFGGILRCETCGRTEPLDSPGARVMGGGWPTCCGGHTMRWWTQRQIDAGEMPDLAR